MEISLEKGVVAIATSLWNLEMVAILVFELHFGQSEPEKQIFALHPGK
jgi:hypothetical protein